jgi:gamma-glutamyltranspeptidase/glutathione hydrolase
MTDFFSSGRRPILSGEAMIATSHPLATAAGLGVLQDGGNAVDAALAAVAVQSVVEPHMTGIGGDCFALYAPAGGAVVALNGSGRAPAASSAAALRDAGMTGIPHESPHAVTVPGAISAWTRLHGDYGRTPLDRLFRPAIHYAEHGYLVAPRVAYDWAVARATLARHPGTAATFLKDGNPPAAGARHSQPLLGQRLREIARDGAKAFYEGATAARLVRYLRSLGGVHTEEDFAAGIATADYVAPISSLYRGHEILECPPNGQGVVALMILGILEGFDLSADLPPAERIHLHAEATKRAYRARDEILGHPDDRSDIVARLLDPVRCAADRAAIRATTAGRAPATSEVEHRDTICLSVVDRDGNVISFINSIFQAFGSYILEPETGVLLHSRGSSFRLEEGHPNMLAPGRRPLHTIIPGMVRRAGRIVMPFGVMGGHYQAAGHAAFLSGMLDQGLEIQAAIDAPRSFVFDNVLEVEPAFDGAVADRLGAWGHDVRIATKPIGGAQAIWIDHERGVLSGGSDPRKDGCAMGL